ncbi:hypothetical protein MHYP_G00057850 [Metynnis hypsauchen]
MLSRVGHVRRCTATLSPFLGVLASRLKHTLPDLPYDYGALEPHVCAEIMQLHHSKHHATYVNNLNVAEEKYHEALAKGELMEAVKRDFGSFQNLKEKMSAATIAVQGSGWGWLGFDKESRRLRIAACANQDPLQGTTGLIPLLGIDVWEHAYYLQYKNVRPDYVKAIWNIVNWENVNERFQVAKKPDKISVQDMRAAPSSHDGKWDKTIDIGGMDAVVLNNVLRVFSLFSLSRPAIHLGTVSSRSTTCLLVVDISTMSGFSFRNGEGVDTALRRRVTLARSHSISSGSVVHVAAYAGVVMDE